MYGFLTGYMTSLLETVSLSDIWLVTWVFDWLHDYMVVYMTK